MGRKAILENLENEFFGSSLDPSDETLVRVLFGCRGIGKSIIAAEFASRNKKRLSYRFLVNLRNAETEKRSYLEILERDFGETHLQDQLGVDSLRRYFFSKLVNVSPYEKPWLLIYENVENPLKGNSYIPKRGGFVLINTSKRRVWNDHHYLQEVGALEPEEAVDLICRITKKGESKEIHELAKRLHYYPLAIEIVAGRIESSIDTVEKFLQELPDEPWTDNRTRLEFYEETMESVWSIVFQSLEKENPLALKWLRVASYFNSEYIPLKWLKIWLEEEMSHPDWQNQSRFIMECLKNSALIQKGKLEETFSIHEFVQTIIEKRKAEKLNEEKRQAIRLMTKPIKEFQSFDMNFIQQLMAQMLFKSQPNVDKEVSDYAYHLEIGTLHIISALEKGHFDDFNEYELFHLMEHSKSINFQLTNYPTALLFAKYSYDIFDKYSDVFSEISPTTDLNYVKMDLSISVLNIIMFCACFVSNTDENVGGLIREDLIDDLNSYVHEFVQSNWQYYKNPLNPNLCQALDWSANALRCLGQEERSMHFLDHALEIFDHLPFEDLPSFFPVEDWKGYELFSVPRFDAESALRLKISRQLIDLGKHHEALSYLKGVWDLITFQEELLAQEKSKTKSRSHKEQQSIDDVKSQMKGILNSMRKPS